MSRKQPPKNSTWIQLTKDFVSEWPEVLEGLQFQNMPVKYLIYVTIYVKNLTIRYDIQKELKTKSQQRIAKSLEQMLKQYFDKIINVDLKFNIPALKRDMESKTSMLMAKSFKK
jgi:hypothetical protein|tara:strand:+ start:1239 stop:1580 length:342 start_codon:yes stop_codon:yes gene_type:complete